MIFRRIVIPLVTTYALFIVMAVAFLRRPSFVRGEPPTSEDRAAALRQLVATVAGGYVFFLLIVQVFHVWIAGQQGALKSAVAGGAFLALGVALPLFLVTLWWPSRR